MKILHITTGRILYSGQRRQLEFEHSAAKRANIQWTTVALHTERPQSAFEVQIPRAFRSRILLRVYGWYYGIKEGRRYDLVLFRDMQLDVLGPFFGIFLRNRVTVHHAKEIEELTVLRGGGCHSKLAVMVEKYIKPMAMRSALGLSGVTHEIRDYEISRFPHLKDRSLVIPNGFDFLSAQAVPDHRGAQELNLAFVCAEFAEWHGLDRLFAAIKSKKAESIRPAVIHLVGRLMPDDAQRARELSGAGIRFEVHGSIPAEDVSAVLAKCHAAIASLAMDRSGLIEGTTLKVREYLAAGVPVYATHRDAGLPEDFPYFFNDPDGVSLYRLLQFAENSSQIDRDRVREVSRKYLDKQEIMLRTVSALGEVFPQLLTAANR